MSYLPYKDGNEQNHLLISIYNFRKVFVHFLHEKGSQFYGIHQFQTYRQNLTNRKFRPLHIFLPPNLELPPGRYQESNEKKKNSFCIKRYRISQQTQFSISKKIQCSYRKTEMFLEMLYSL